MVNRSISVSDTLRRELDRARQLLASRPTKLFPTISLETRKSLAVLLSNENSIDRLLAAAELNRPLKYEVAPWEDDPELRDVLERMEDEERNEQIERQKYQEECTRRLEIAQNDFELFQAGVKSTPRSEQPRKSVLKAKNQGDRTTPSSKRLTRRHSFVVGTPVSQREIILTCTSCNETTGAIVSADELTAIVDPTHFSRDGRVLPVTSTPHNRKYRSRASSVDSSSRFASPLYSEKKLQVPRKLRRSSTVYFEDEIRPVNDSSKRDSLATGETCAAGEQWTSRRSSTFVADSNEGSCGKQANTTFLKRSDTTIISPANETAVISPKKPDVNPKIVSTRGRAGSIAKQTRQPIVVLKSSKLAQKAVLPTKISSNLPERPSRSAMRKPTAQKPISSTMPKTQKTSTSRTTATNRVLTERKL